MIIFFTFAQFSLRTFIRVSAKALFQLETEVIDFAWIVIYFISRSVVLLLTENENVYHLQTILYFMIGHRRNLWYKPKKEEDPKCIPDGLMHEHMFLEEHVQSK